MFFFLPSLNGFLPYPDNLRKAEPDKCPVIIASTPREPVSCSKQWTTAAISLLTTCRSPMDSQLVLNEKCSMNQLNELGEFQSNYLGDAQFGDTKFDQPSTQHSYRPRPQKRYSICESKNGLFRLRTAKDAFDKVSRRVMNTHGECDLKGDCKANLKNLKNTLKIDLSGLKFGMKSELRIDSKSDLNSDQQLNYLKSDLKSDTRPVIGDRELNRRHEFRLETNDVIIEDNLLTRSDLLSNDDLDDLNVNRDSRNEIMPEPLFTELELDELCNRSLNCSSDSSNSSNSSIDCKQQTLELKNQLNLVNRLNDHDLSGNGDGKMDVTSVRPNTLDGRLNRVVEVKRLDRFGDKVDRGNELKDQNMNSLREANGTHRSLEHDVQKDHKSLVDRKQDEQQQQRSIIDGEQTSSLKSGSEDVKRLRDALKVDASDAVNNNNVINGVMNNVKTKLNDATGDVKNSIKNSKNELNSIRNDVNDIRETITNQSNLSDLTKNRIDQLIDNCLRKRNHSMAMSNSSNDQFNFEQQTDNLVEEIYFTAELGDHYQQKTVELCASSIGSEPGGEQIEREAEQKPPHQTSSKTSSVSITKIQVYSQSATATRSKSISNETDQFELQSNSSAESLSKYPDDGVELSKVDEEEETKCDSEDVCKSSVK